MTAGLGFSSISALIERRYSARFRYFHSFSRPWGEGAKERERGKRNMRPQTNTWLRFLIVAGFIFATGLFLRSRAQADILPPREPLSSFPLNIGNWQGAEVTIPQWALDVLGAGEFAERRFARSSDERSVDLFLAYFPSQRMGSTMHSPQNCLPGSGWTPINSSRVELARPEGGKMRVNRYVLARGMDHLLVYYWFQEHGRVVASEYWSKFYLVADAIRINRSDGALVRVMTGIDDPARADKRAVDFVETILPSLDRYIPR